MNSDSQPDSGAVPEGGDEGDIYFQDGDLVEVDVGDDEPVPDDEDENPDYEDEAMVDVEDEPDLNIVDMSTASFNQHTDSVYSVAFHPTEAGLMVSGGGDDRAFMWRYDASASQPDIISTDIDGNDVTETDSPPPASRNVIWSQELGGHTDTVTTVSFNFDGTLLLTGGYDGKVNIWTVATGELLFALEGPEDVEFACWHSKGNAVLAGSKDGTIWMWLAQTGQCVQVFAGHDGGVSCGLFTKDGKNICSAGEDGSVRVWGPKTGACKHVFGSSSGGHQAEVTCLENSSDGELLLSGSMDGTVRLFHISGKRLLQTFVHCTPKKIESDAAVGEGGPSGGGPEGAMEETGSDDDEDDEGEEELEEVKAVECVGFAAKDLKWLASGGADFTLKIWDLNTGTCRCVCRHEDSVVTLKWHESLPVVATGCLDFNVRVWDARSGACMSLLSGHRNLVTSIQFKSTLSGEGEAIASVSDDGTSKIFRLDTRAMLLA